MEILRWHSKQVTLDVISSKNANYFSGRRLNTPLGQFDTFMTLEQVVNFLLIYFIGAKLSSYIDYTFL